MNVRPASFKGIPFGVESTEVAGGHNFAIHSFPGGTEDSPRSPYPEPTGRKGREYPVEAFIVDDDYEAHRDALIAACERGEAGELVHPYYGTLQVVCEAFRVRESGGEQRVARFSLKFIEAGAAPQPTQVPDVVSGLFATVSAALEAFNDAFEEAFSVTDRPSFVVDKAIELLADAADLTEKATSGFLTQAQNIEDLSYKIRNFKADLKDLVNTPAELALRMSDAMASLTSLLPDGDRKEIAAGYSSLFLYGEDLPAVAETTANREQEAANQQAIQDFVRRTAIVYAVQEAAQAEYESFDQASAARTVLSDAIDEQLETTVDDEAFQQLVNMRAQVVSTIPPVEEDLPRLVPFTPLDTVPAVVLAYDLYKSLDLEQAIILRNRISHPGFIPGGRELQILRR